MTTNLQYMKREQFQSTVQVLLYLNLNGSYSAAMDITDWVRDINIDVAEGTVDTSGNTSGQLIDKIELLLDNTRGDFDPTGRFFNAGIMNNSKIKIISAYTQATVANGIIYPGTALTPYTFNGVLKADSSTYYYSGPDRLFRAGILQAANIMASEIINSKYLTSSGSMADVILAIMSQPTIAAVLGISAGNINLDFDIAGCVDSISNLYNQKVLDVVNTIGILSNSKWRIDQDGNFIMEPVKNSGTSSWDLGIDDIVSIEELGFNPLQFNSITWDDGNVASQNVQMDYDLRQRYGYDCFDKKIDIKWVSNSSNRLAIISNYLLNSQFQHRMITFTCKSNPEIRHNQLITLDVPRQYARNSLSFVWGKSSWGNGSKWTPSISGIKISPGILWRVISVKRKLNLAPDMQIIAVQAGIGQDAAL